MTNEEDSILPDRGCARVRDPVCSYVEQKMKTMLKLYAVAALCLMALSSEAVVGEHRLEKKPRQKLKIYSVRWHYCRQCRKKFYNARYLNARGYCSSCWCKQALSEAQSEAKSRYELLARIADAAYPEKRCEVHRWKEIHAPRFGGDYYTEYTKAKYAQNYMKALELQERGLLKCMCHDSEYVKHWTECCARADEAKKKWSELKLKQALMKKDL